eukprot:11209949-Lingulodinium_polyedra.AAC.1
MATSWATTINGGKMPWNLREIVPFALRCQRGTDCLGHFDDKVARDRPDPVGENPPRVHRR